MVVLHEVAHVVTSPGAESHGPEFAAILLALVDLYVTPEAGDELWQQFVDYHIVVSDLEDALEKSRGSISRL